MPFPTRPLLKLSKSSKSYINTQLRDPYIKARQAHPAQYRSRSAFKLLELDEKYGNFLTANVNSVVDLGAAPGGWSQVVAGKMGWTDEKELGIVSREPGVGWGTRKGNRQGPIGETDWGKKGPSPYDAFYDTAPKSQVPAEPGRGVIVAADLLPMAPIAGVRTLELDFLSPQAEALIHNMVKTPDNPTGKVDLILSDMAANFTGNRAADTEASLKICMAVFDFAEKNLRGMYETGKTTTGMLLMKHFAHPLLTQYQKEVLEPNFHYVAYCKPDASRKESAEGYWLCKGWKG
ncbi:23S ribosomal RNA methyltransferase [Athelia psychrophila]|uniref:rRNA methyltransferase 2, mitochondrial n=1 Tax=Athelia psychrophila TaxID=1759441 RepID=A0A166MQY3_9AGAM|nr:23S ribosomal RNA methyltransferase [Fibularhizoctonia sp. CBS 109695]